MNHHCNFQLFCIGCVHECAPRVTCRVLTISETDAVSNSECKEKTVLSSAAQQTEKARHAMVEFAFWASEGSFQIHGRHATNSLRYAQQHRC